MRASRLFRRLGLRSISQNALGELRTLDTRGNAWINVPQMGRSLSHSVSPNRTAVLNKSKILPKMVAAEAGWLQEEVLSDWFDEPIPLGKPRFDWTRRGYSQRNERWLNSSNGTDVKAGPPKRYKPKPPHIDANDPFFLAIQQYSQKFEPLLKFEQEEEEKLVQERLREWPVKRLQEEGYCILGLRGFWLKATQFGRPVACFSLGPGKRLGWTRFERATQVILSPGDPLGHETCFGSVISKTTTKITVSFNSKFDLEQNEWRLDLSFSDIAYRRSMEAIQCLYYDPEQLELLSTGSPETILQGTMLRDQVLRSFDPLNTVHAISPSKLVGGADGAFADNQLIQSWTRRYQKENPVVVEGDPQLNLNRAQVRAIATMLGERLSLIQGPPGTGKTRTIIEAVRLLKAHFQVPYPILVCTYTNVAVDNLVEGFAATGVVSPLRVGFATKVKSSLHPHTLEAKIAVHPIQAEIKELEKKIKVLEKKIHELEEKLDRRGSSLSSVEEKRMSGRLAGMRRDLNAKSAAVYGKERAMLHDIVTKADVICTTCITSASAALQVIDFPVVFLDEASMSTEPASLIPIMKGSRHVALIGDHKQLPPVITSTQAKSGGLAVSLFERLTQEGNTPSVMLDLQYRMHPSLSRFPSAEFYNLELKDGTVDSITGSISADLLPPKSQHLRSREDPTTGNLASMIFLDHSGAEAKKARSRVNFNEAAIVCEIVEDLLLNNPELRGEDIGVISPYIAQIALIDRMLKTDLPQRVRFTQALGRLRALETSSIEVKTVDGFEGREKDIVIFSTVRSNRFGHIGFLADRRRMNVGLTRAKRGLFLIGNLNTLRMGKAGFLVDQGVDKSLAMDIEADVDLDRDADAPPRPDPVEETFPTSAIETEGMERVEGARVWRRYIQWLEAQKLVLKRDEPPSKSSGHHSPSLFQSHTLSNRGSGGFGGMWGGPSVTVPPPMTSSPRSPMLRA